MKAFFRNIVYSGIQDRLTAEQRVKLLFVNTVIVIGLIVLGFFTSRDFVAGHLDLALPTLGVSLVIVALFFAIRLTKSPTLGAWFLPFLMFAFFTYLNITGGPNTTASLWSLTFPLIVTFMIGTTWGGALAGVFMATQLVLFFAPGLSPLAATAFEFKIRMAGTYTIIFAFSMAFETIRVQTQTSLENLAGELAAAKVQTDGILHSVTEGIFLLDKDLIIGDQHSTSLSKVLDVESPAGRTLPDILRGRIGDRDRDATRDYLEMYFLPDPPWHLMEEINPLSQLSMASPDGTLKHLTFAFTAVELSTGRRVLATVRDVTQSFELSQKLKAEEDRSARQMKHLFQIIHVKPELLLQFLQDADEEIATINRRLKDPKSEAATLVEDLFQGVHAVKGNAALVGLSAFAQRVHELETKVSDFRGKVPVWQDFLEMTVRLSVIQAELTEIRELLGRMSTFQRGLEASAGGKDLLLLSLEKAVDKMGQDTGMSVDLDVSQFETEVVPEKYRKLVKDILVQLVRNSFVHGLETGPERRTSGKPPRPRIRVAALPTGRSLTLAYWDDGRGIDPRRLKQAAQKVPGWSGGDASALTDEQALQLVFSPGVSTATEAGIHAGRGVGLGLVKERVEAAGGKVRLRSVPGRGVAFDITLPMA
jgi:two-component system chemotaxis sensor kinase CheA